MDKIINPKQREKFCIFCGQPPKDKNKEHVIPKWLIKMTGKENRKIFLGLDWSSASLERREFSWGSFSFPACEKCNERWSSIEARVKTIVTKIMDRQPLASSDFLLLLDWVDKVRTGLWLGFYYLNKNYRNIVPGFHIDSRVARQDRALFIYKSQEEMTGIGLSGIDTPIFHKMPSVMQFSINNYHFISVSSMMILSKKLGWPYLKDRKYESFSSDRFSGELIVLKKTESSKLIPNDPLLSGTMISQPIAPPEMIKDEEDSRLYENSNVREISVEQRLGFGRILIGNDKPVVYPDQPSTDWIPRASYPYLDLMREVTMFSHALQCSLFQDHPDFSNLSDPEQEIRRFEVDEVLKLQNLMFQHHILQLLQQLDERTLNFPLSNR